MATFKARTSDEIFKSILDSKSNYSNLDNLKNLDITDEQSLFNKLQSTVRVSIWILWAHLTALSIWALENILEIGITEQEEIRDSSFFGNANWIEYVAKQFQVDDEVIINAETNKISYSLIDESKQIVGNCVAIQSPGAAIIKIRGKNTDILTENELTQFSTYLNRVGILGVNYIIQNSNPDVLKITGVIKYKGEKSEGTIKSLVEDAINNYIRNISFNSEFITNELVKLILNIDGVIDFEISDLQAKPSSGAYSSILYRYTTNAGYMIIDENFALSNTISYKIEKIY
jgi:hypothetical protein